MFRCWITEKTSHWCCYWPLVVLLFLLVLLLSIWFIIVWSTAFSPTVCTFIKTRPHIMAAFSNGAHRSQKTEVDTDCIRKRTCTNSSPLLHLPLEQIWNSDFTSESNSLIKFWWIIYRICTYAGKTTVALETLGVPWRSWLKENNKAYGRMSRLKLLL